MGRSFPLPPKLCEWLSMAWIPTLTLLKFAQVLLSQAVNAGLSQPKLRSRFTRKEMSREKTSLAA
jgi:hypothetical protein